MRPSAERWAGAIEQLAAVHTDLGWIPLSAIEHVADELGVTPKSVRGRLGELGRAAVRTWRAGLPQTVAISIARCPDFGCALRELSSRLPSQEPVAAEIALWATSDRLIGALKARERDRRSPDAACPLCRPGAPPHTTGGPRRDNRHPTR